MYILDPDKGRRRRAGIRDRVVRTFHESESAVEVTGRDLGHRAQGMIAKAKSGAHRLPGMPTSASIDDGILVARVRSKLGRFVSHPHAVEVAANAGTVTLSGPVLKRELRHLLSRVNRIPGVSRVENRLELHRSAEHIDRLQGGRPAVGERFELLQTHWSPAARFVVSALGAGSLVFGARRGGPLGRALVVISSIFLARAFTNRPAKSLYGLAAFRRKKRAS